MISFNVHRFCTLSINGLCAALFGCAALASHAAELSAGMQPMKLPVELQLAAAGSLQLQFARSLTRPAESHTPPATEDEFAYAEDCEEIIEATPVITLPHPVPAAAEAGAPLLAKAEPSVQPAPQRTADIPPQEPVPAPAAPLAQAPKETQPLLSAPSVPSVEPAAPAQPAAIWEIAPADKTLNTALARWATSAGWQLLWELPVDYTIEASTSVSGTFEEAVDAIARSVEAADTPMQAIFYKGNKVLRIIAKGSE